MSVTEMQLHKVAQIIEANKELIKADDTVYLCPRKV
jgi:hypothetical protein